MAQPTDELWNSLGRIKREPESPNPFDEEEYDEGPRTPTYGPQSRYLKIEAPKEEEEPEIKQIVYRCPHKRDEGGRCNSKETNFNFLLAHFYKHHAKERLLSNARPKFTMCCFRTDCTSKFWKHKELVEHMFEHDKDPGENIYFVSYIKELYEKENKELDVQVKNFTEEVKNLKNENLEIKQNFDKKESELKELKKDKKYYKEKYGKEKEKNKEHITSIEQERAKNKEQINYVEQEKAKNKEHIASIEQEKTKNKEHVACIEQEKSKNKELIASFEQEKAKNKEHIASIEQEKAKNKGHMDSIEKHLKTIERIDVLTKNQQETITERTTKINLKDKLIKNNLSKIEKQETKIKELQTKIDKTPTSTSNNQDETNKKLEKKDKKIDDLKRKEKILLQEVAKLNKELLDWRLKKDGSSSDSDSDTSSSSNLEQKCKTGKQKRKHPDSSTSSEKDGKKRENVEHSSDEPSETENNCSTRKKKCSLNVVSQSEYKEDNETDTNLEQEEYVEHGYEHEPRIKPDSN